MRPSSRRCVLGLTTRQPRCHQPSHKSVTFAKGRETSLISTVLTERAFRQEMDGRAADRQLRVDHKPGTPRTPVEVITGPMGVEVTLLAGHT
jgi:hypothetical protein